MLSEKQIIYSRYLLRKFGFDDEEYLQKILQIYASVYRKVVFIRSYNRRKFNQTQMHIVSECIENFLIEKSLREKRNEIILKKSDLQYLRATDLANYAFCPVSYVISKSFVIEHLTNAKLIEIGESLHSKLNILKRIGDYKKGDYYEDSIFNDNIIKKIRDSEVVYSGHDSNDESKTFYNCKSRISCEPDFIFKNREGDYFIVEEKFQYYRNPEEWYFKKKWIDNTDDNQLEDEYENRSMNFERKSNKIYFNHVIQTYAYLKNINEYDLKYAYLIYWYYDIGELSPYVFKLKTYKIEVGDYYDRCYNSILDDLLIVNSGGVLDFNVNCNPYKCAGCSVNKYCGHKNRKYNKISYPYNLEYLKLFKVEFPIELKKTTPNTG